MKYEIQDWAGNRLTAHGEFKTFDDGWDYIYEKFEEDDFQDLYVVEVGTDA